MWGATAMLAASTTARISSAQRSSWLSKRRSTGTSTEALSLLGPSAFEISDHTFSEYKTLQTSPNCWFRGKYGKIWLSSHWGPPGPASLRKRAKTRSPADDTGLGLSRARGGQAPKTMGRNGQFEGNTHPLGSPFVDP